MTSIPPLYSVWSGMKQRCFNPRVHQWKDYGGRGITVCERWLTFAHFAADMGDRPEGYWLDRIDNDGNYEPSNCRWASPKDQLRNQRCTRKVTVDGIEYVAADLADQSGLKTDSIVERAAKGLSLSEILSPAKRHNLNGLALGGFANGRRQQEKGVCPAGHPYSEDNTYVSDQGWRRCRRCRADREIARRKRRA